MTQNLTLTRQSSGANIRPAEGAGTTTLTDRDSRWQVFNLSAARTVVLPSDGAAGDVWQISNSGAGTLTLQSSGLNTIASFAAGSILVAALQAAPTSSSHWTLGANGLPPSAMSDSQATMLGLKVYSNGTSYNGGNAPTLALFSGAGTLNSVNYSQFIPYQMQDGSWRMKFNFSVLLSFLARTAVEITINGVATPASGLQTFSAAIGGAVALTRPQISATTARFYFEYPSTASTEHYAAGDIILAAKPNWAY